ncbi:MAG: SCO family protein [Aigarchaeota archaeon]|nr:SCO family protein [Aigarchaeota archaeon]MDW8092837.1 SCO family protein [Nitrososphaerota archaeon]
MRRKIYLVVFSIILFSLAILLFNYYWSRPSDTKNITEVISGRQLPDFTLIDQYNNDFSLAKVKGRPIILFFGYTNCPDVCPYAMMKISESLRESMKLLNRDVESFAVIFITVDPLRDTPQVLSLWASKYYAYTIALTGDLEELKRVWTIYGVVRAEDYDEISIVGGYYFISHSAVIYVADKNHILRYILTPETSIDEFKRALLDVLRS